MSRQSNTSKMLPKMRFLILIAFVLVSLGVQAQRSIHRTFTLDTLTNTGTNNYALSQTDITDLGSLFYHVSGTPISGTVTGTINYQISNNGGTTWHTMATDTLTTGAATNQSYQLDNFAGNTARVSIVGGGTQTSSYRVSIGYKRNY